MHSSRTIDRSGTVPSGSKGTGKESPHLLRGAQEESTNDFSVDLNIDNPRLVSNRASHGMSRQEIPYLLRGPKNGKRQEKFWYQYIFCDDR